MSRTVIDLDDEALEVAARFLGTTTKKDTVNAALREIADRRRRAAALERMQQMVAEGKFDFSIIGYPDEPETAVKKAG
jgi:Arc/MetJ family transcription regulator